MPDEEEALRLLEERRKVHVPDDSQRVIPSKKRESKKKKSGKGRKRKRDSPSHGESAAKKVSLDTIHTAVPLQARSAGGETSTPPAEAPISPKDKETVGESSAAPEPQIKEVYRRRDVIPFQHDIFFNELGHKGMITRFNRATSHLISRNDVDHLESLPPIDRVRQLQASAAEVRCYVFHNLFK